MSLVLLFNQQFGGGAYFGVLKRWTGSVWIKEPLKTYLSGLWQTKTLKYWSGTQWLEVDITGI